MSVHFFPVCRGAPSELSVGWFQSCSWVGFCSVCVVCFCAYNCLPSMQPLATCTRVLGLHYFIRIVCVLYVFIWYCFARQLLLALHFVFWMSFGVFIVAFITTISPTHSLRFVCIVFNASTCSKYAERLSEIFIFHLLRYKLDRDGSQFCRLNLLQI